MPQLDTSAAESAKNLLNGIDYGALIGGPLTAAIQAQAMAARSTWEFIQEVGLNTDQDGNKTAVNVTFLYMNNGELVRLVVPILVIVPIPLIIVDEVDIQFKASINASASQASEQSSESQVGGKLSASGSIGWGPFSLKASLTASYSSKQDSKATQDSRYSVEYTQNVRVHATQADMPAGLATVLNILSSSTTAGSKDGTVKVSPTVGSLSLTDPDTKQNLLIKVSDANGLVVSGANVKIDGIPDWLSFGLAPLGQSISGQQAPSITLPSDDKGQVNLLFWIDSANQQSAAGQQPFQLDISADVDKVTKTGSFPMKVAGALPGPASNASIEADPTSISDLAHDDNGGKTVTVTVKGTDGQAPASATVTATASGKVEVDPTSVSVSNGQGSLTVKPASGAASGDTGTVTLNYTPDGGAAVTTTIDITLT